MAPTRQLCRRTSSIPVPRDFVGLAGTFYLPGVRSRRPNRPHPKNAWFSSRIQWFEQFSEERPCAFNPLVATSPGKHFDLSGFDPHDFDVGFKHYASVVGCRREQGPMTAPTLLSTSPPPRALPQWCLSCKRLVQECRRTYLR